MPIAMLQIRGTKSFFKVGASRDVSGFLLASEGLLTTSHSRSRTQLLDPLVSPGPEYRKPYSYFYFSSLDNAVNIYKDYISN